MESKFGFKYIELTLIWLAARSRVIKINAKNYNLKLLMFYNRHRYAVREVRVDCTLNIFN